MKKRIERYLNSKHKYDYNNLDKIFELYIKGDIKKMLSKYEEIGIYSTFNKLGKNLQLNYNFHNIYVIIDFFETKYNVVVYHAGTSVDDLERLSIDYDYPDDFSLIKLINNIDFKIQNHPKLTDTTVFKKKKRIYNLIAWISWCLPILYCGSVAIFINEKTIKVNPIWVILFVALPLIIGCIFDIKSTRLKLDNSVKCRH